MEFFLAVEKKKKNQIFKIIYTTDKVYNSICYLFQQGVQMGGSYIDHELPPELIQQGWRKFWSKRENRPYYWNRASGESLWDMPQGSGVCKKFFFSPVNLQSSVTYLIDRCITIAN